MGKKQPNRGMVATFLVRQLRDKSSNVFKMSVQELLLGFTYRLCRAIEQHLIDLMIDLLGAEKLTVFDGHLSLF